MTEDPRWNDGLNLFIESLHKPDHELRNAAKDQGCYEELMDIRRLVIEFTEELRET